MQVRPLWLAGIALATALPPAAAISGERSGAEPAAEGGGAFPPGCAAPAQPLRYPQVAPIFEQHCAKCHDARLGRNDPAQAVFEMTSYPFATRRPGTLLADLRGMFLHRGSLSAAEKCRGVQWLSTGGLDADGRPPRWR